MRPYLPQKTLKASPEVKAFIYQQINEFENFLPSGSSVGVLLHEAHDHVVATIEIHTVKGNIQTHGVGQDPIEALVDAKYSMIYQLELISALEAEDDSGKQQKSFKIHRYRH